MSNPAFSVHAVERYIERVKPALDLKAARAELQRLGPLGEIVTERPAWAGDGKPTERYLILADGICFPIVGHCAVTCLTKGSMHRNLRAARNAARARRTFARTHKRRPEGRPSMEQAA